MKPIKYIHVFSLWVIMLIVMTVTGCTLDCGLNRFCFNGEMAARPPTCERCWKCCLWPDIFGECPLACDCKTGKLCMNNSADCGEGLICKQNRCEFNKSITPREAWIKYEGVDPVSKMIELRGWANWDTDRCNITRGLGCPCLFTNNPYRNMLPCDTGFKCVSLQGVQSWDAFSLGKLLYSVQAICERCGLGEICEKGTIGFRTKTCPPGYICDSLQGVYKEVDPGHWSDGYGGGTCGILTLLNTTAMVSTNVFDTVKGGRTPLRGTYCPLGSTNPFGLCPRGYYCPNESLALPCEKGMICKEGSIQPRRCSTFGICDGSTQTWHIGVLLWAIGIIGFCIVGLMIQNNIQLPRFNMKKEKSSSSTGYEGVLTLSQTEKYKQLIKKFKSESEQVMCIPAFAKSFQEDAYVTAESITRSRQLTELTVLGLEVKVGERTILYPNSVTFKPCGVNAIMGASGCGKSTLLSALMGKVRQGQSGKLILKTLSGLDDCERGGEKNIHVVDLGSGEVDINVQQIRAFVPQDDIVCGDLTVRENIAFSMLLNVHHTGNMHLSSTVDWVMEQLQIKHISNNIVGTIERRGISGGQRKRVSIGMGMACLPSLLLLDEPTSGLDATTSEALLNVFGNLTRVGITIVCVLHQPRYECWMLLDQVLLLSKYGTLFFGSPSLAILYFTRSLNLSVNINENPADAIMDIISSHEKDYVKSWVDTGFAWCKDVCESHPHLHVALNQDIFFDASTKKSVEYLVLFNGLDITDENTVVTPKDIREFIKHKLGMRVGLGIQQLNRWFEYISERWGDGQDVKFKELALALQDVTLTVKLQGKHENIIDKVSVINSVQQNSSASLKVIILVRRFISNCRKKVQANGQHPWAAAQKSAKKLSTSRTHMNDKGFVNEVIYFVMLLKALGKTHPYLGISDSMNKIMNSSVFPFVPEDKVKEGRIPSINDPFLRMCWYVWVLTRRKLLSIWRSAWSVQLMMPLIAAIIVGKIHGSSWSARDLPSNIVMAASCLGVLSAVTHIRTFALDRLMMRRDEITFAYLVAYGTADFLWIALALPLVFGIPYWLLISPYSGWGIWWTTWIGVTWWTSGVVYIVGVLPLALHWLNIIAAFISVIFGAFINGLNNGVPIWLNNLSYAKWATENILIGEFQTGKIDLMIQDNPHYSISTVAGVLGKLGFCKSVVSKDANIHSLLLKLIHSENPWKDCNTHLWVLFLIGALGRIIAAILLICIENSEHIKLWVDTLRTHILHMFYKKKAPKRRRRSVDTNDLRMSTYYLESPVH